MVFLNIIMDSQIIIQNISSSKKYKTIYPKTIERIVEECYVKYGKKHAEEKARDLLHQVWAAYYPARPNFKKLLKKFQEKEIEIDGLQQLLSLQTSTRERIPLLDRFYPEIFSLTGKPDSIIDHACGLNPLTLPWMHIPKETTYKAFDIDQEEINFMQAILGQMKIPQPFYIEAGDVLTDPLPYADVVFMLKLLPCLEHQEKNAGLKTMKEQACKFLVVSFPVKSLGGKEKGMADFYTEKFLQDIRQENWKYEKLLFETELVFVIKKG